MGSPMDSTYGAMFIGGGDFTSLQTAKFLTTRLVLFATFFQGVLTVQAYLYFENFPEDRRRVKLLVATVWILDAIHLVLICQACYHYLITSWGNDAALLISTKELDLHLIFVGLAMLVCQGFFIYRILSLSNNWWLTTVLSAACLIAFALEVAISAQILQVSSVTYFNEHTGEVVALFAMGGAVDFAITLVLVFYLQQGKTQFDLTNFVLARVIHYSVATGLVTSVLAVACLITYLVLPHTFIFIAMHFSLGRLYTNALLATLNSRRILRRAALTVMTTRVVTSTVDDDYPMALRSTKDLPEPPTPRS
ncbi:hypothetical protein C8F04DRAFT_1322562 [Mycena alexandri]|uniref:DUF6534 domain-containing protein n=1 Tax=Mycena alexandri TaxID=1745969 RepID=A0AAD6TH05_9AGAR|nr:hypothetical protein C8F04DRAFT_1322562 [Mycena alexandri]